MPQKWIHLKLLGLELINEIVAEKSVSKNLATGIRELTAKYAELVVEDQRESSPNKREYCKYCKRFKTRYFGKFSKNYLWMEHITLTCLLHNEIIFIFAYYLTCFIYCVDAMNIFSIYFILICSLV